MKSKNTLIFSKLHRLNSLFEGDLIRLMDNRKVLKVNN